jgi:hypothetical protein
MANDVAEKQEAARKEAVAQSTVPKSLAVLTPAELAERIRTQLGHVKNPGHTSDMHRVEAERIEVLLEALLEKVPADKPAKKDEPVVA